MSAPPDPSRFRNNFLLGLVLAISALFLLVVGPFLLPLFMGAIFTGLLHPLHHRILTRVGGRASLAALLTLLIAVTVVVIPLTVFAGLVIDQALDIGMSAERWIQENYSAEDPLAPFIERFPVLERLEPYREEIMTRIGELAGTVGGFIVQIMGAAGRGTVSFILAQFVMLYAMFFFLRDGKEILERILYLMPLPPESEHRLVERFRSVTRATVKGTLVIGLVQGGLAGLSFLVAGVPGFALWTTVMVVLSVIPAVGTAFVWIPAVIYLFTEGRVMSAVLVGIWCALVVGSADNVLRPRLVGRDTQMSDIMVLVSTMGGLILFGAAGVFIGPIVGALFITVWDLYAIEFKGLLPETTIGDA